jgi:hypothetical protein
MGIKSISFLILDRKTSLTPQRFIEVAETSQENERSRVCVLGVSILSFYDLSIRFWNCADSTVFSLYL